MVPRQAKEPQKSAAIRRDHRSTRRVFKRLSRAERGGRRLRITTPLSGLSARDRTSSKTARSFRRLGCA
ncbi:hypothetical protein MRX96_017696 [Rhipicephalus microplus]